MSAPHRPGQPWREHPSRPGETERIPRVQDGPLRFEEPRPPAPPGNPALSWVLRGLGLVGVAVVSGLVWWYVNDETPSKPAADGPPSSQASQGRYQFAAHEKLPQPKIDTDCATNSYGETQKFFQATPCTRLTRALYTTEVDGKRVYTSVAVVRMPAEDQAQHLYELTGRDNTGNVSDAVRALVPVDGLPKGLGGGDGYKAVRQGPVVIIVESDYAPAGKRTAAEEAFLKGISTDAIRFGEELATKS